MFSEEGLQHTGNEEEVDVGDNQGEVFTEVPGSRLTGVFVSGSVVNLSCKRLTEDQIKLLSRGLKFKVKVKVQLKLDIEEFKRQMRLKWYFRDNNIDDSSLGSSCPDNNNHYNNNGPCFYIESGWNPPRADPILETYS